MFLKDDVEEPTTVEESDDESLEEEQMWEDDDFGECDRERVPKDLEASEMVDLVDEVLDEGLADYSYEAGFIKLKDLRDQVFVGNTFSQKPKDNKEPDYQTFDNCHTRWNGENQQEDADGVGDVFPFTQMCIELSDRVSNDEQGVEDDQGIEDIEELLDGVHNYVSHETPDIEGLLNMLFTSLAQTVTLAKQLRIAHKIWSSYVKCSM
ncbi:hypothetical protein Tco_0185182 [Tanacetum coccineum]